MIIHDTSKVHTLKFISSEHFTCAVDIYSFFFALWENEQHISTFVWNSFMIFFFLLLSLFTIPLDVSLYSLHQLTVDDIVALCIRISLLHRAVIFLWMKNNAEYELFFIWKGFIHVVHVNALNEHWSSFWRVFLLTNWNYIERKQLV